MKPEDILTKYNGEIRGFYNYFSIANNACAQCSTFGYIMEWSLYLTLGQKLNLSSMQVKKKFCENKDFVIHYKDKKDRDCRRVFYNEGFKRQKPQFDSYVDVEPMSFSLPKPSLVERLKTGRCELCGKEGKVMMHHVRKLTLLSGETPWDKWMLEHKRKTLVVCEDCNRLIQQSTSERH